MQSTLTAAGLLVAVVVLILLGLVLIVTRLYKKVEQGRALIISKIRGVSVTFTGAIVLPVFHKAEYMDISVKTIDIERTGHEGLICKDNIRADIRITFFVRVNKTVEDVVKVAQAIGTHRASDQETLQELFNAKFSEALKTVGKQLDFVDLYTKRDEFRDWIIRVIGTDLNGYSLEDAAIDYLEQTPMSRLDPANILDAQGIRKITELTALEAIRTNDYQRNKEKEVTRQDVEARETILELERQQADAEIKQRREVETMRAREEAEIEKVQADERLKAQGAAIRTEEQLGIQRENQQREIAVAELNKQRVVAIETEKIEKDRQLEVVNRDRETALATIEKDKEVETEKRSVAEIVRERVAVDKTVAEQEENIKRVRTVEEAERNREATVIAAEAQAQEQLVKDIKAAEAAEQAAQHRAREELTLAEARQQASDLDARAKIRLAEGVQAEVAAAGLAESQVITEKAAAMAALDEASRSHEEYRLRLDMEKELRLAGLDVHRQVAEAQASVIAAGLENADIDIVGGESVFFDRLVGSITLGKSLDGLVEGSDVAQRLAGSWLNGDSDFVEDIRHMLGSVGTDDVKNMTVSALLLKLMKDGGPGADQLQRLLDAAREHGVADQKIAALANPADDGPSEPATAKT
ncbi:MAG TPA: hypothetical protein VFZ37_01525 [Jiangellaceae bacterium]